MYHKHFNTIPSTQTYLKDNLEKLKSENFNILISASEQTQGIGSRGNTWDTLPNSLAMSFTLKPTNVPTLTPLEIGITTIKFFKEYFNQNIFMKWPNDILASNGKKCGGILCQYINESTVIVGLGVNLGKNDVDKTDYRHGVGSVDPTLVLQPFDQEKIALQLYNKCLSERLDADEVATLFTNFCFHINKNVQIFEDGKDHVGIFRGIGSKGEALVEIDSTIQSFFSSSLTILN